MPRINVTDEELAALEKIRTKHREIVGWNAAIAQVVLLFDTGALTKGLYIDADIQRNIQTELASLKKDLPL